MPGRLLAIVVVVGALALPVGAHAYTPSQPAYSMTTQEEYVPMDDGVELAATVGLPSQEGGAPAPGRFPVILTMTPYSKAAGGPSSFWVSRGYVHAVVDIRGAGESEGNLNENYFSPREQRDGAILVEHFAAKPYSNGRVGMTGGSYLGITQYMTAGQRPPHLKAIVPSVALEDLYRDAAYHGGILSQFFGAQYLALQQNGLGMLSGPQDPNDPDRALGAKLDQAQSDSIAWDYLANTTYTRFYRERSPGPLARRIKVPALIYDGWFDGFVRGASEMYGHLSKRKRVETRLWIDPVPHKGTAGPLNPQGYPAEKLESFQNATLEFLDRHLKRMKTPARPRVKLFVMGRDGYITSKKWPPAGVRYQRFHLRPGEISTRAGGEASEQYLTNPADGWTNTFSRHGNLAITPYLPLDQSLEGRHGIVWETGALERALTLAGPMSLRLVAQSTSPDTDWIVASPTSTSGGKATLLSEGYLRASHRALDRRRSRPERPYHPHTDPKPIEPGRWYAYDVEVWPTANEFRAGHRLRVQLTSHDFPNHTPGAFTVDRDNPSRVEIRPHQPGVNTVRYGRRGSSLLLPVLRPKR